MKGKSFTWLYVKRSFTKNLKKQLYLILGIAAFMAMIVEQVIESDTNYNDVAEVIEKTYWGYRQKYFGISAEMREFITEHPDVTDVYVAKYLEIIDGITNGNFLVSADFPKEFMVEYVYGTEPKRGEVALPESARIAGKRPEIGQEIVFAVGLGEKKQNVCAKVSGVFKEHAVYTEAYVAMYGEEFDALLAQMDLNGECLGDVFFNCADEETLWNVWGETVEKYGWSFKSVGQGAGETGTIRDGAKIITRNLYLPIVIGSISMIAIIYIVLKDEKKTFGVLRALGATKWQIVKMLTARMVLLSLVGCIFGVLLGQEMIWLKRFLMYEKESYNPGILSVIIIPLAAIVLFLVFQIPAVLYILRKPETALLNEVETRGEHLISFKNKRLHRLKNPLWWYSGVEPKRRRMNTFVLCVVTMSSLTHMVSNLLLADSSLQYDSLYAVETDYAVSRKEGSFSKAEIESILNLTGVSVSSYGVQMHEKDLATWNEVNLCAKIQIIEENSFQEFKVAQSKAPRLKRFKGTLEEALAGERILIEPTYNLAGIGTMQEGENLLIRNAKGERIPFEIATVGAKKQDGTCDCYIYVGFDTYERLFGSPKLTKFHIMLDEISFKEAKKTIESMSNLYELTENDVLVGYTEGQLNWDTIVNLAGQMIISLLLSFSFLICYYSFYFLSRKEEYWMLYAQGASKKMLQKIILFQAFRLAVAASVVTAAVAIVVAFWKEKKAMLMLEGLANISFFWWMIPIIMIFVIVVSMSATWIASKTMLKEIEINVN